MSVHAFGLKVIMPGKTVQHSNADVFTAIAHPVRRQILDHLIEGDRTVKGLAGQFADISRPAISQHLAILLEVGLVSMRDEGRENYYHLQPERLEEVEAWVRHYERFWHKKLDRLGEYLQRKASDET
jgi:DNA-binding transcriptional ArsR family regulator